FLGAGLGSILGSGSTLGSIFGSTLGSTFGSILGSTFGSGSILASGRCLVVLSGKTAELVSDAVFSRGGAKPANCHRAGSKCRAAATIAPKNNKITAAVKSRLTRRRRRQRLTPSVGELAMSAKRICRASLGSDGTGRLMVVGAAAAGLEGLGGVACAARRLKGLRAVTTSAGVW